VTVSQFQIAPIGAVPIMSPSSSSFSSSSSPSSVSHVKIEGGVKSEFNNDDDDDDDDDDFLTVADDARFEAERRAYPSWRVAQPLSEAQVRSASALVL
jgi:hypothetical protein